MFSLPTSTSGDHVLLRYIETPQVKSFTLPSLESHEVRMRDNPRYNLSPIISISPYVFPTALCLLLLKLVGLLVEHRFLLLWLDVSAGELKEMLIALFIMMYILSLYNKEKNLTRVQTGECRKSS